MNHEETGNPNIAKRGQIESLIKVLPAKRSPAPAGFTAAEIRVQALTLSSFKAYKVW